MREKNGKKKRVFFEETQKTHKKRKFRGVLH
jgi:hypothetical protein